MSESNACSSIKGLLIALRITIYSRRKEKEKEDKEEKQCRPRKRYRSKFINK
jgi:hypothetical protein